MNCLIDLHLHLDGSLSLDTVKTIAEMQGIQLESDAELIKKLRVSPGCADLNEYLEKFDFPLSLMQTEEAIKYSVSSIIKELAEKGFIYAEIRFAPQLHTKKGLSQEDTVIAALEGMKDSRIPVNLILCAMRADDNCTENKLTVDTAKKYLGQGVCAIDLAGAEGLYPTENFEYLSEYANKSGVPFTIHAGEADGPESVYKAIEMGARRIGHGVRSYEDKNLVRKLRNLRIPLELCPTSNLNTGIFSSISEYPIMEYIKNGVIVTVNSDNMTVSDTDAGRELTLLMDTFSLDEEDIKNLLINSARSSFADNNTKAELVNKIKNNFNLYA